MKMVAIFSIQFDLIFVIELLYNLIFEQMLQLSHEKIIFQWKDMKKSLLLTNNSDSSIIYKVKSNVLNLIVATPCKGFIQPKHTVTIQIKCQKLQAFQAKFQVNYAVYVEMKSSIDQTWSSLAKNQFKHHLVYLSKEEPSTKDKNIKEQNESKVNFKLESSSMHSSMSQSIYQSQNNLKIQQPSMFQTRKEPLQIIQSITTPISQRSQKQQHKNFIKKTKVHQINSMQQDASRFQEQIYEQELKRSKNTVISQNQINKKKALMIKTHSRNIISERQSSYNYMNHSQLVRLATVQQQLLKQKQINQKLTNKLIKTNQLQKQRYSYDMQSRVNKSMETCPEDHFSFMTILVVCIIFFVIGFLIAKF